MGRTGVSEYQVFQAADQLRVDSVNPSVDSVRQELGNTGSRTTINKYLKAWRERNAVREQAGANLGDHLLQVLREQAELILSAIEATAQAKFQAKSAEQEAAMEQLRRQISDQDTELSNYRSKLNALETVHAQHLSTIQQLQSQLTDAREDHRSVAESLAKESGRREILESAIEERDRQLATLKKEMKALQVRNEILTEAHANKAADLHQLQQRERDQRSLITERNAEIKRLNQELKTHKQRTERDLTRLTDSIRQLAKVPAQRATKNGKARQKA